MKISDLMSTKVRIIGPEAMVGEIARMMRDEDVGAVPVAEKYRLIGMVTDRDIVVRGVADGSDPGTLTARKVMTDKVLYCFSDQSPQEVLDNMGDVQVRRLPVLDRDKKLVGIVSIGDLAAGSPTKKVGEALKGISKDRPAASA